MPQDKESITDRRVDPTLYDAYTPAQIAKRFETANPTAYFDEQKAKKNHGPDQNFKNQGIGNSVP